MSKDFWDQAAHDARIRRVSQMIPDDATLTQDNVRQIMVGLASYMREFDISQAQLARAIGTNEAYVSDLLARRSQLPMATRNRLLRAANNWMEEDFRARVARKPEHFVELRSSRRIIEAARNIKATRTIGVVDGPAGIGKSLTARFLESELPGTMVVTVDYDCRTARGLLRKIYLASKLRRNARANPRLSDVIERLAGSGRLLVIDQAHDLFNAGAFKLVQDLHDACELPILLLGTVDIHKRLTDDEDPQFGQLASRIGLRIHLFDELFRTGTGGRRLQWVSVDELRRIFDHGKLKLHADTLRLLCQIANFETGHLRRVKWLVRYAEGIARAAKARVILPAHLLKAIEVVAGERRSLPPIESTEVAEATA